MKRYRVAGFDVVAEYPSAEHPRFRPLQLASSQVFSTLGAPGLKLVRRSVAPGLAAPSEPPDHWYARLLLVRASARWWAPRQGVDV